MKSFLIFIFQFLLNIQVIQDSMGQNDSKQIQDNVLELQKQNVILHHQAQKFLHDYHTNDNNIRDVKLFEDRKMKMFLKYFILQKYPLRSQQKQNTKRVKTNQSVNSNHVNEQKNIFDNLSGALCFQTYKIQQNYSKICSLIMSMILSNSQSEKSNKNNSLSHSSSSSLYQKQIKEVLKLIGVKQCHFFITNKHNNIQQKKILFNQIYDRIIIDEHVKIHNSYPVGKKYKFRKMKKTELVKENILLLNGQFTQTKGQNDRQNCQNQNMQQSQASSLASASEVYFVQQSIFSSLHTATLIVNLKQHQLMQKKQIQLLVQRYLSNVSQFLYKILYEGQNQNLPQIQSQPTKALLCQPTIQSTSNRVSFETELLSSQNRQIKQTSKSYNIFQNISKNELASGLQTKNLSFICWNIIKIYKIFTQFQHSAFIQKVKTQNKKSLNLNTSETSLAYIRQKLIESNSSSTENNKRNPHHQKIQDQQQQDPLTQTITFLDQYEQKYILFKSQLCEYVQKFFKKVYDEEQKNILELEFDEETELKMIIAGCQQKGKHYNATSQNMIKQNQSDAGSNWLQKVKYLQERNISLTLLDIFKDHKQFQQFYKKSYKHANSNLQKQRTKNLYQQKGISIQFKFLKDNIYKIRISLSLLLQASLKQEDNHFLTKKNEIKNQELIAQQEKNKQLQSPQTSQKLILKNSRMINTMNNNDRQNNNANNKTSIKSIPRNFQTSNDTQSNKNKKKFTPFHNNVDKLNDEPKEQCMTTNDKKINSQKQNVIVSSAKSLASKNSLSSIKKLGFDQIVILDQNNSNEQHASNKNVLNNAKQESPLKQIKEITEYLLSPPQNKLVSLSMNNDFQQSQKYFCNPDLNILNISNQTKSQRKVLKLAYDMMLQITSFMKNRFEGNKQQDEVTTWKHRIINFLIKLRDGYEQHKNPFHNFQHGVNVMHTAFTMCQMNTVSSLLDDFTKFILVMSALCHDIGHTGFNNAFQVASGSQLAIRYNDISPLQNYHIFRTLSLLKSQQLNFLSIISAQQKTKFRKLFISNILNTDMKQHFNVLKNFQSKKNNFLVNLNSKQNKKISDLQEQKIFCGMIIHSSDFGGSIKQFQICQEWSKRVNEQFKNQSVKEKQLGLPLSPFMLNLDNPLIMAKNQLGFLKFMVQPLYKSISQTFAEQKLALKMFNRTNQNIGRWELIIKQLNEPKPQPIIKQLS